MGIRNELLIGGQSGPSCCRTPGAVYTTTIRPNVLAAFVRLPVRLELFTTLSEHQERKLIADLHDAILPVIEGVYRDTWRHLAGKTLPECGDKPMPERWEDLVSPTFARGTFDGGDAVLAAAQRVLDSASQPFMGDRVAVSDNTISALRSAMFFRSVSRGEVEALAQSVASDEYGPINMMRAWPAHSDDDSPPDATTLARALSMHDGLPDEHRPSDREPLRNCLPGIWPSVGDLRALLAQSAATGGEDLTTGGASS